MAVTTVPKELREKLGEAGVEALAAFVNAAIDDGKGNLLQIVEERFARRLAEENGKLRADVHEGLASQRVELLTRMTNLEAKVREELANTRAESREVLANMRAESREELANMRAEFKVAIADAKSTMVRWMFLFWITQMAAFLAIVWKVIP
jgi:multidrug resistance efflux pump